MVISKNLDIDLAVIKDAKKIHLCNKYCLPIYYSIDDYKSFIIDKDKIVLVANYNGSIVGYIYAYKEFVNKANVLKCRIASFGVMPDQRGIGLGTMLVNSLIGKLRIYCNKYIVLTLLVKTDNIPAINFYLKNGFIKAKKLPNYYNIKGNYYNAYLMYRFVE